MPDKRNIIEEAVDELKQLKSHALVNAKRALSEEMSAELKKAVSDAVNEELGGGGDPPSGYDPDKGDTREDGSEGDELEDEGDGPAIIEAGIDEEDDMDVDFEEDDDDDFGIEEEGDDFDFDMEEEDDFDDDDDMDLDSGDDEMDLSDDDDEEIDIDIEDDDDEEEAFEASVQNEVRKLKRSLREANRRASRAERAIQIMKETVEEVNLFNARLTGVQKLQNRVALSEGQRDRVVERFDECESISEVKRTYKALIEGFRSQKSKSRNRIRRPNHQTSNSTQLTESEGSYKRMQELAKLI